MEVFSLHPHWQVRLTQRRLFFSVPLLSISLAIVAPDRAPSQRPARTHICSVTHEGDESTGFHSDTWPARLQRGDTIGVAREMAGMSLFCPAEMPTLKVLLPFLNDPARSDALGLGGRPSDEIG